MILGEELKWEKNKRLSWERETDSDSQLLWWHNGNTNSLPYDTTRKSMLCNKEAIMVDECKGLANKQMMSHSKGINRWTNVINITMIVCRDFIVMATIFQTYIHNRVLFVRKTILMTVILTFDIFNDLEHLLGLMYSHFLFILLVCLSLFLSISVFVCVSHSFYLCLTLYAILLLSKLPL